jgi:hypothetical protein
MTNASPQPPIKPTSRSIYDDLAPYAQQIAYVLIGIGVAFSLIPIVLLARYGYDNIVMPLWGGFACLLFLGVGGWYLTTAKEGAGVGGADLIRLIVLIVGGLGGFSTALLGLALPLFQYSDKFSGGLQAWRENRVPLSLCALAFLGGLVLMFLGLMQARAYERTSPALRRLLYGYNAVLGGLLLFSALALINILPYSPVWPLSLLAKPIDMTNSGEFTLKPSTVAMLGALNKPLKIYVLLTDRDNLDDQTAILLNQARSANGMISWETVSRDLSPDKWKELEKDYKIPGGGMLLVYGTPPDVSTEHIKLNDLLLVRPRPDGTRQVTYNGEYALMGAITLLYEGKSRPVIYFTQGNGELEMHGLGVEDRSQAMTLFIEELSKGNYDLKPLPFDRKALEKSKTVPDDAEVVVIAGPQTPLMPDAVETLRKYVQTPQGAKNKKGKLIVLLDVVVDKEKKAMVQTNLEPLLREYGVEVGNNYVPMQTESGVSRSVVAIANPGNKSPIGPAFTTRQSVTLFAFNMARTMQPGQGRGSAQADTLLMTYPNAPTWAETDLVTPPADIVRALEKRGEEPIYQRLSLGVTVTEPRESSDLPLGHPSPDQTPRMVVIGNARWLADDSEPKLRARNVALLGSCLSWLRERPDIGPPPEPPDRKTYTLKLPDTSSERRLEWLPGLLVLLGIATTGGGVWIVRRR